MVATISKGNILRNTRYSNHAIVLAVKGDGSRVKVYAYGPDKEAWHPVSWYEVVESGEVTCHKCGGSGLYYFGGAVVNGVYTGQTGDCYACGGKGKQDDGDRVRCHGYWHRGGRNLTVDDFTPEAN